MPRKQRQQQQESTPLLSAEGTSSQLASDNSRHDVHLQNDSSNGHTRRRGGGSVHHRGDANNDDDDYEGFCTKIINLQRELSCVQNHIAKIWGPEPPYLGEVEDDSGLVSRFLYVWVSQFISRAAKEELTADTMTRPTRASRSWNLGRRLSTYFRTREMGVKYLWEPAVQHQCRVSHKNDPMSRGYVRWYGYLQQSNSPHDLQIGVEWVILPKQYKEEEEERGRDQSAGSPLDTSEDNERDPLIGEEGGYQKTKKNNHHHYRDHKHHNEKKLTNGTHNGETLFSLRDENTLGTFEHPSGIEFVDQRITKLLSSKGSTNRVEANEEEEHHVPDEIKNRRRTIQAFLKHHDGACYPRAPSLMWSLFTEYRPLVLRQFFPKLLGDACTLASPVVLELFIKFLQDDDATWGHGMALVAIFFAILAVQCVSLHKYYHLAIDAGISFRSGLLAAIFEKCFTVSDKSLCRPEMNPGRIVTMVSADAERASEVNWYVMYFWAAPISVLVGIGLLYRVVGWVAFVGISGIIVTMPAQALIIRKQHAYRTKLLRATDARVKATNELFSGIRIVKFMGWESKFIELIRERRLTEIRYLKSLQNLRVASSFINVASPSLIIAIVFILYHVTGHDLTPEVVFPAIALLGILRIPFLVIPMLFSSFISFRVSMGRITQFMELGDDVECISSPPPQGGGEGDGSSASIRPNLITKFTAENDEADGDDDVFKVESSSSSSRNRDVTSTRLNEKYAIILDDATISAHVAHKLPNCIEPKEKLLARVVAMFPSCCCGINGMKFQHANEDRLKEEFHSLDKKDLLAGCSLEIPKGKLTVIIGPTGCGKSTILNGILGSVEVSAGRIMCNETIAFAPQQPWIMNGTIKENIVFFSDYDESKFARVLSCCQLDADLAVLTDGVATEIGEKGVNLSGGQKARISLARAVYSDRELYLLDDPISALDAHVGEMVIEECFLTELKTKTRVLATHHIHVAPRADHIVILSDNGEVFYSGSYTDYCETMKSREISSELLCEDKSSKPENTSFNSIPLSVTPFLSFTPGSTLPAHSPDTSAAKKFLSQTNELSGSKEKTESKEAHGDLGDEGTPIPFNDFGGDDEDHNTVEESGKDDNSEKDSLKKNDNDKTPTTLTSSSDGKLMTVEEKPVGTVPLSTYLNYFRACGGLHIALGVLVVYIITEAVNVSGVVWLSAWSVNTYSLPQNKYLYVYIGIVMAGAMGAAVRSYTAYAAMRYGSINIHQNVLLSVIIAPMSFFDTTPLGRILNRFSKDIDVTDNDLQQSFIVLLQMMMGLFSSLGVMVASQPLVLAAIIPCCVLYYKILVFYNAANREIRRVSSILKSPVFALLSEILNGRVSIRAYDKESIVHQEALRRLDNISASGIMQNVCNRWLGIRLEFIGAVIVSSVAFLGVVTKMEHFGGAANIGIVSLGLTLSLNITTTMNFLMRSLAAVESDMNSQERLESYTYEIDHEDVPEVIESMKTHTSLPPIESRIPISEDQASIVFESVCLRYRPGLPLVLNNLSFSILPQEKVAVVGRTASGKSTLLLAFLRIVDIASGSVHIGSHPISMFGLRELRSKFAMIPQEPLLLEGTVRSNLDPFNEIDNDALIWEALEKVGMKDRIEGHQGGSTVGNSITDVGDTVVMKSSRAASSTGTSNTQHRGVPASNRALQSFHENNEKISGLNSPISDGGRNFSVGQRQLLCLARALLKNACSFILMDEATANIDPKLDAVIQTTIKKGFAGKTVITIAHRLDTIVGYDKVLVLDHGSLAESGRPSELAQDTKSIFRGMIAAQGKRQERKIMQTINKLREDRRKTMMMMTERRQSNNDGFHDRSPPALSPSSDSRDSANRLVTSTSSSYSPSEGTRVGNENITSSAPSLLGNPDQQHGLVVDSDHNDDNDDEVNAFSEPSCEKDDDHSSVSTASSSSSFTSSNEADDRAMIDEVST